MLRLGLGLGLALTAAACGGEDESSAGAGEGVSGSGAGASGGTGGGSAGSGGSGQSGSGGSSGAELGWQTLVRGSWSIAPGSESYFCVRKTLERDLVVRSFESINPPGTHHTVLTVGEPSGADGFFPCDSFANHATLIFGSGVGTNPFELPDGVGVTLQAGRQLLLNLHIFNTGADELTGESGTRVDVVAPDSIEFEAESILAGTVAISLPPGEETETEGNCTLTSASTLFAVQPHMHQLGKHMTVTARTAQGDVLLHDDAYDFGEQPIVPMKPLELLPGDRLHVVCTHLNSTGDLVQWGESSKSEMCHAGVYRYPAESSRGYFFCSQ
jgi:hypothetical protein